MEMSNIWMAFVNIRAQIGLVFMELIDIDENPTDHSYDGAWANILIKAENINRALDLIPQGLAELGFDVAYIDKIENVNSLIESNELDSSVILESEWLCASEYVFKISDRLFPYSDIEP